MPVFARHSDDHALFATAGGLSRRLPVGPPKRLCGKFIYIGE